jgi:type 1 glutamine amidotransferase
MRTLKSQTMINFLSLGGLLALLLITPWKVSAQPGQWITYEGKEGPGKGKHIVLVSGDEEYRSEESLPMLAQILSQRHGFTCTVLFAQDSATGEINPDNQTNIPGLSQLEKADLLLMCLRFRELPDEQMKYIDNYVQSGKPIVAMRTSTHAFRYTRNKQSRYAKYGMDSKVKGWEKGFGKSVLGETWVAHHGEHGVQGTRGIANGLYENHPVLKGVGDIWGPTDVYAISSLEANTQVLIWGQTTQALRPDSNPVYTKPIMPVAWIKNYRTANGKSARIFNTTMGASMDLLNEDLRRLLVNACYWSMGLEDLIPEKANVEPVNTYQPIMFGFGKFKKGVKPSDVGPK